MSHITCKEATVPDRLFGEVQPLVLMLHENWAASGCGYADKNSLSGEKSVG
jgi:hypothetical protein